MIAGAGPMPPIPSLARAGSAVASADSGTIRSPNSAIDGIVCNRFSTANSGPCQARMPHRGDAERDADQHRRSDRSGDENDVPNQRRGEHIAVRPIFAGERQRVEQAGIEPSRRSPRRAPR